MSFVAEWSCDTFWPMKCERESAYSFWENAALTLAPPIHPPCLFPLLPTSNMVMNMSHPLRIMEQKGLQDNEDLVEQFTSPGPPGILLVVEAEIYTPSLLKLLKLVSATTSEHSTKHTIARHYNLLYR